MEVTHGNRKETTKETVKATETYGPDAYQDGLELEARLREEIKQCPR